MEDATQVFAGSMALVGVIFAVLGCWFAWPRQVKSQRKLAGFGLARAQTVLGIAIAVLGVILAVIGLASRPMY